MRLTRWAAAFVLFLGAGATAQGTGRQRLSMDPGWRFTLGDPAGAEQPGVRRSCVAPRSTCRTTGASRERCAEDAPGGGQSAFLPGGIGWYRKAFRMPPSAHGVAGIGSSSTAST